MHTQRDLDEAFAWCEQRLECVEVVESISDFVHAPRAPYRHVLRALELLGPLEDAYAQRALGRALTHRLIKARRLAAAQVRPGVVAWERVVGRLRRESAHLVRVELVGLLARAPEPVCWEIAWACDDPNWRVRKAVLEALDGWGGERDALRARLEREVHARGLDGDRSRGVLAYHDLVGHTERSVDVCTPEVHGGVWDLDLTGRWWWSVEPSLMRGHLEAMTREEACDEQEWLVWLLEDPDPWVRSKVRKLLVPQLTVQGLVSFLIMASEPRRHGMEVTAPEVLARVHGDTREAAAEWILGRVGSEGTLSESVGLPPLCVDEEALVRWARGGSLWGEEPRDDLGDDALTREEAEAILADVGRWSWRVLARAADVCGRNVRSCVPVEWMEPFEVLARPARVEVVDDGPVLEEPEQRGPWWEPRRLGPTRFEVARMGISGHYALPERGFEEAFERGIRLYFWEPIYLTQTRFFASLPPSKKSDVAMCCGTFEASVRGLRRDVEKALRAMGLEQLGVFFVFWVRDRERLSDELLREMERMRAEGMVDTFGVSTHSRELARGFIEEWPAVMVRHNAAHRGVESDVFPYVDHGRSALITFSNLCYGRMISELPDWHEAPPSARDAYRYTLSHDAVSACWSAPSTVAQLRENLSALDAGPMGEEELERMRAYGRALYRRNTGFGRFVRGR